MGAWAELKRAGGKMRWDRIWAGIVGVLAAGGVLLLAMGLTGKIGPRLSSALATSLGLETPTEEALRFQIELDELPPGVDDEARDEVTRFIGSKADIDDGVGRQVSDWVASFRYRGNRLWDPSGKSGMTSRTVVPQPYGAGAASNSWPMPSGH